MRFLAFAFAMITAFALFGSNSADSVKVYFRIGQSKFEPNYNGNRSTMDAFLEEVRAEKNADNIEKIVVKGYASPDGGGNVNVALSRRRCETIVDIIEKETSLDKNLIQSSPQGIAWDELREIVVRTPEVPYQQRVLDILDNTPVIVFDANGSIVDSKKRQLMRVGGGESYKWLYRNVFPSLRCAGVVVLYLKSAHTPQVVEIIEETVAESSENNEIPVEEKVVVAIDSVVVDPIATSDEVRDSRFALKTNLLFYAILMPNIEAEWMFADRWSAALEVQGAWYSVNSHSKVYRLATITPEVRYWPIEHSRWNGMYVGVFGGAGMYDLYKDGKKGHEGEGFMVGVSAGYMWPISKHLSLEAGIGIGYLSARDKVYTPLDGHYLYQLTKNINYFGPLRLKFSLVWRIPW